jgi:DNA-directed RNA polymerase specialized sigma24 family protein
MEDLTHLGQPSEDGDDSEESLIARYVTTGDELAFKAVYDRYWDELNNFVRHHLEGASAADVDKMLQQASRGLHCCRGRFLPGVHIRPMLYRIVEYHCNDYIRVAENRRRDNCTANPCWNEQNHDRIDSDLGHQR